jgi:hypothetical protein
MTIVQWQIESKENPEPNLIDSTENKLFRAMQNCTFWCFPNKLKHGTQAKCSKGDTTPWYVLLTRKKFGYDFYWKVCFLNFLLISRTRNLNGEGSPFRLKWRVLPGYFLRHKSYFPRHKVTSHDTKLLPHVCFFLLSEVILCRRK